MLKKKQASNNNNNNNNSNKIPNKNNNKTCHTKPTNINMTLLLVFLVQHRARQGPPFREPKIWSSNPAFDGIFSGSNHTSDLKIGTPVATLPGAWRYRVSAGTGWPGVSILLLGEMEILISNFYLSVAAREIV